MSLNLTSSFSIDPFSSPILAILTLSVITSEAFCIFYNDGANLAACYLFVLFPLLGITAGLDIFLLAEYYVLLDSSTLKGTFLDTGWAVLSYPTAVTPAFCELEK
jgi:hypothetical protein